MWPTWPMVGFSAASPVRTLLPPCSPATQCRPSRAWFSANSFSTLTCRIMPGSPLMAPPCGELIAAPVPDHGRGRGSCGRLPPLEDGVHAGGVGRRRPAARESAVGEHLGELGQELQVLLGRLLGHQQHEDLRDGLAVGRVERDRRLEADEAPCACARPRIRPCGMATPWPEPGRAELLAREQAVDDDLARTGRGSPRRARRRPRTGAPWTPRRGRAGRSRPAATRRSGSSEAKDGSWRGRWQRRCPRRKSKPADLPARRRERLRGVYARFAGEPPPASAIRRGRRAPARRPLRSPRASRLIAAPSCRCSGAPLLVLQHLAVELVGERVDRRVHVGLDGLDVDVLAPRVQVRPRPCAAACPPTSPR